MVKRRKQKLKKKNKTVISKPPKNGIIGGVLGDRDQRTKAGRHNLVSLLLALVLMIGGSVYWGFQHHQYSNYLINNTTPDGTNLQFTQSGTTIALNDVWTDRSRDLIVVHLRYPEAAHQALSSDGRNYKMYLAMTGQKPSKNLQMRYGLLGTDGGGYLFIRGKFQQRAYQVFLTNKKQLSQDSLDSNPAASASADSTSGTITAAMDSADLNSANDKGILSFANNKKTSTATEDYINFRINPYSETTHVSSTSFLTKNGEIDYSAVVEAMSTRDMTKSLQKNIDKHEARIKTLNATIHDYQQRLRENRNDDIAGSGISTAKTSLGQENDTVKNLKDELEKYNNHKFDESSFGHMQTKFTLLTK